LPIVLEKELLGFLPIGFSWKIQIPERRISAKDGYISQNLLLFILM